MTFGVPFPRGRASKEWAWQLVDSSQRSLPVQARVLDTWPDGSVRWLLIDGRIDIANGDHGQFRLVPSEEPQVASPLRVDQDERGVVIDTGTARFEFRQGAAFPLAGVARAAEAAQDQTNTAFEVTDVFGRVHRGSTKRVTVVEDGPLRASVRLDGALEDAADLPIELTAYVDLYAGLSVARVTVRLRNPRPAHHPGGFWDLGDPGSVLLKDVSWRIALPPDLASEPSVRCSPERGIDAGVFSKPFELYQDSSGGQNWRSTNHINRDRRVPVTFRGYRMRSAGTQTEGLRATPIVTQASGAAEVSIAVPLFWQNFPKAIEASGSALTFRLFPGQFGDLHEIQGGEQKTHVWFISFGADGVSDAPLDWCRSPIVCRVDPGWIVSSEAVAWLSLDDAERAALVASAVEGSDTFEHKREVVDEYGWRHFGDVYGDHEAIRHTGPMPLASHYNNQYDAIAGFIYEYLRGGDHEWWSMARELVSHVIDIDVYHTTGDKWSYNHGMFWHTYHYGDADTSTHRSYPRAARGIVHGGGPSPDHSYTTGLMLHHLLTGDQASRDTVLDLGQYIVDADDGRKTIFRFLSNARTGFATASGSYSYHGPGRGPANSLNDLLDAHRLSGEPRFIQKAEELIRRVVHPEESIERRGLDDIEYKWFYLMFLQSLGKYLWYKNELDQRDEMYAYGRAALLHYARWMSGNEYPYLDHPERLEFPTETWAAQEVRKSDVFYHAALHAEGDERDRFLERGRFFFAYATRTLAQMPTRTLARPVIVLLSSGLMKPWYEAVQRAPLPPVENPHVDFGQPLEFVPQKQIAIHRAKLLLGAATGMALLALAILIYWFA